MKLAVLSIVLATASLAGCLDDSKNDVNNPNAPTVPGIQEWDDPEQWDLEIAAGLPEESTVSALVWQVDGASSAVILVHGHSGVKENYWHTAPALGSAFGSRVADSGRTVIALDLPGYGQSDGDPNMVTFDAMADAVRAVADIARSGEQGLAKHDAVVGFGLSMGAIIVNLAAAGDSALDAIIPTGYPMTLPTDDGRACLTEPCPAQEKLYAGEFHVDNVDLEVANATMTGYESGQHDANIPHYVAWEGDCSTWLVAGILPVPPPTIPPCTGQGRASLTAAQVAVPVFTWVGDHDLPWLGTDLAEEASHYPNSPRVDTWVVPQAGHFIPNHASQPHMVERLDTWLLDIGF